MLPQKVHSSSRAAITKYHRLGGLNNRNLIFRDSLFSHSSRGWKCKMRVSAGLVSPEARLLGVHTLPLTRRPLSVRMHLCCFFPSHSDASRDGAILVTSFHLSCLFKGPVLEDCQGFTALASAFWENTI